MTVTTHAAVSFSFSFVFTHDLCNTHYITYFMAHLFYAFLAPPIVVGVLLTCQSLDPEYIYIYIYAFSRRFYPKRLTLHSSYSFTFYQLLLSLGIKPMILTLLAPCSTIWATGKPNIKAKVYFTFYAYARDFLTLTIFVTERTLYAQVAHAHWSYFAVIMFSHMVATLSRAVENEIKEMDNANKIAETATTDTHIDERLWARGYETAQLWFKRVQKYLLSVMT